MAALPQYLAACAGGLAPCGAARPGCPVHRSRMRRGRHDGRCPCSASPAARASAGCVALTPGASSRSLSWRSDRRVGAPLSPSVGMRRAEAWLGLRQGSRRRRCRASRRSPRSGGSSAPWSRPRTPTSRAWSSRCRRSCSRTWPPRSRRGRGAAAPALHASQCRVDARRVPVSGAAHADLRACHPAAPRTLSSSEGSVN